MAEAVTYKNVVLFITGPAPCYLILSWSTVLLTKPILVHSSLWKRYKCVDVGKYLDISLCVQKKANPACLR